MLRSNFERWGLPKAIRADNGSPWATQSDIPSALALWFIGLGVRMLLNRPRQSTDNGIVERDHGVLANWVEAHTASIAQALQQRLDWAIEMQRERYPAIDGQSRAQAHPELFTNPRAYTTTHESTLWQLARVDAYLSQLVWLRWVDKVGRISLFSQTYSVGRPYAGQRVWVRFDADTREWGIEDEQGQLLKRHATQEITPDRILGLSLAKRANTVSHDPV